MLKYEMFSNFYRSEKAQRDTENKTKHEIHGTLAVASEPLPTLPIGRRTSRTWWEAGWSLKK